MTKVDILRNEIIEKVLTISDTRYLNAIQLIVESKDSSEEILRLTSEQKEILDLSEQDIINGRVISHEELMRKERAWLKGI